MNMVCDRVEITVGWTWGNIYKCVSLSAYLTRESDRLLRLISLLCMVQVEVIALGVDHGVANPSMTLYDAGDHFKF